MPFGSVYKIVFPNGKHYIGLTTTSLEQRQREHKCSAKNGDTKCLYNALRSHKMVDTFKLIEIDTADTLEELCEKEIHYILEYNSYYKDENGYNMTYGGEASNGYVFTEDDKQKISEAQKKRFENPEEIKKLSEAVKKRFENPDERAKQCIRMKKRFEDNPDLSQKCSESQKKRYEDNPEARQKMSEIKKKYYEENPEAGKEHGEKMKKRYEDNPELRTKMSEIKKECWDNAEARTKQSERVKKYYEGNPEAGKEHGEKIKQLYENTPGLREKCSESQKTRFNNPEEKEKILDAKGRNKPFDVFKADGTFIKTFNYQFHAKEYLQKEYHITSTIKIVEVLAGRRGSSAGFVFKYK